MKKTKDPDTKDHPQVGSTELLSIPSLALRLTREVGPTAGESQEVVYTDSDNLTLHDTKTKDQELKKIEFDYNEVERKIMQDFHAMEEELKKLH